MEIEEIASGRWRVFVAHASSSLLVRELERTGPEADRVIAVFDRFAAIGPESYDTERCHQIVRGLFQIRCGQLRIMWFYDEGRIIVCCHAFRKKGAKTPRGEISAALKVKEAYFQAKESRSIVIID